MTTKGGANSPGDASKDQLIDKTVEKAAKQIRRDEYRPHGLAPEIRFSDAFVEGTAKAFDAYGQSLCSSRDVITRKGTPHPPSPELCQTVAITGVMLKELLALRKLTGKSVPGDHGPTQLEMDTINKLHYPIRIERGNK